MTILEDEIEEQDKKALEDIKGYVAQELKNEFFTSFSSRFWVRNYDRASTVLIKCAAAIGDSLCVTAVVHALKAKYPQLRIHVSGRDFVRAIYFNHPDIEGVILAGSDEEIYLETLADVVVDYNDIIGLLPEYFNQLGFMDILGNLAGVRLVDKSILYKIEMEEAQWAESTLKKLNKPERLIGLQLSTNKDPKRCYPYEAELIHELTKHNAGFGFLVLGLDSIAVKNENVLNCAEKNYTFRQQMALAANCDAFLTIDSAFFHAGHNVFHKPTMVIVGLTNPVLIGNPKAGFAYVRNEGLSCLNCYWQIRCNIECMKQLEPGYVADQFCKYLAESLIGNVSFR